MMAERFGPMANERYRDYVKDIHASGGHLISLINDLLDLSKIEAGKLELTFDKVSLNDLAQQCVALMQPQANRERIIIRTSLPPALPQIVADARSVRQIVLNLLSNSIKFTEAGGQVIVSTALNDNGDVALRVRDNGIGMSEKDIAIALEPFRQTRNHDPRPRRRHRARPAADQGAGRSQPRPLPDQEFAQAKGRWSKSRFRRPANSRPERDQFHSLRQERIGPSERVPDRCSRARSRANGRHAFYIRGMGKEPADAPAMRE